MVLTSFDPLARWHGWGQSGQTVKNFHIEAVFMTETCAGQDRYGLVVRMPDLSQGYLVGLSCEGQYALLWSNGKGFDRLIDWTSSAAIAAGSNKTNRLAIAATGDKFTLYANGTQLAEIRDTHASEGRIALFIAAYNTKDFTVKVEEVAYWERP